MKNGIIIYMSRQRDVPLLFHSLYLLYKNFNAKYKYPVIVFHDDIQMITRSQILLELNKAFGFVPNIKFEELIFKFPDHVSQDPSLYTVSLSQFPIGYRHMCRFHSGEIYRHSSLMQYDWYMRLDSDSFILSPVDFDIFDHMEENGYEYSYMETEIDEPQFVVEELWDTTKRFIAENRISMEYLNSRLKNGEWDNTMFYTNFEAAKFSLFRGDYMKYYEFLDKTGNMYYKRWGDAPIHWLGVRMFLPDDKIWCVKNIAYQHGSFIRNAKCINPSDINYLPNAFKQWAIDAVSQATLT